MNIQWEIILEISSKYEIIPPSEIDCHAEANKIR